MPANHGGSYVIRDGKRELVHRTQLAGTRPAASPKASPKPAAKPEKQKTEEATNG